MTATNQFLMSADELAKLREAFRDQYILDKDGEIFQTPHGAGYWLHGAEFVEGVGWLGFEHGDEIDPWTTDHKAAIKAFKANKPLPVNYHRLDVAFGSKAFDVAVREWGESWMDDIDLPRVDYLIQGTLFNEERYA